VERRELVHDGAGTAARAVDLTRLSGAATSTARMAARTFDDRLRKGKHGNSRDSQNPEILWSGQGIARCQSGHPEWRVRYTGRAIEPRKIDAEGFVAGSGMLKQDLKGMDATENVTRKKSGAAVSGSVKTLDRGMRILDQVITSSKPVKLRDITRQFDIDRATAFRCLQTLCQFGVLRKDPRSKSYAPGGRFHSWLLLAGHRLRIVDSVRPFLDEVVRRTQQSAHLGILIDDEVLLVDFVPSESVVSVRNRIGVLEPLHCTAIGKAVLASLPDQEREVMIRGLTLVAHTPRTITDRASLRRHIAEVRAKGVAMDDGEFNELLACVAVHVATPEGMPTLSIGVSMLRPVIAGNVRILPSVARELKAVVRDLEAALSRS
jgi:DNA-binding IclR family transcriptional regulator